jgi:hypothetical protein
VLLLVGAGEQDARGYAGSRPGDRSQRLGDGTGEQVLYLDQFPGGRGPLADGDEHRTDQLLPGPDHAALGQRLPDQPAYPSASNRSAVSSKPRHGSNPAGLPGVGSRVGAGGRHPDPGQREPGRLRGRHPLGDQRAYGGEQGQILAPVAAVPAMLSWVGPRP